MRAVWCGFALGVVWLQQQASLPGWGARVALVLAACGLVTLAFRCFTVAGVSPWRRRTGWYAVFVAAGCAGFGYAAWRAEVRVADELPVAWEGRDLVVRGWVKGLPSRDADGARFLFAVDTVETAGVPQARFPRVVQLTWIGEEAPPPVLEPGARWRLTVRLKRPHGNANFGVRDQEAVWLARGVRATGYVSVSASATRLTGSARGISVTVDRWRAALRARIDSVLGEAAHRGIVVALAIGAQDAVSAADWLLMRRTGTSHLVAISGLHIGFVAGLAGWLLGALWRRSFFVGRGWPLLLPAQKVAVTGGALFAAFHAALAGFNVPAQRALWMLGVVALAFVGGRSLAASLVLAWALGLVVLIDPWAVLSAGFWLSFCAVGAILFSMSGRVRVVAREQDGWHQDEAGDSSRFVRFVRVAKRWLRGCVERMRSGARVQFAVTIALAPLTLYFFSQIPLIGPLANALAIPWISVLVTPAVIAGIALPAPLDAYAFRLADLLLDVLARGLQVLSGPTWAVWHLPQPGLLAMASAALGVAWCLAPRGWPLRWAAPLTWLPLLVPPPTAPAQGTFRLTALDIGQGSSIVVETAGHTLLFDAGPGPESTHAGERIVVPYLQASGIRTLDALVISHADSDHAGGAPAVLEGVEVRQLLGGLAPDSPLWATARAAGAQAVRCAAGQHWRWDDVDFTVLWPDPGPLQGKPNAHCCVLRVSAAMGDRHRDERPVDEEVLPPVGKRDSTLGSGLDGALAVDGMQAEDVQADGVRSSQLRALGIRADNMQTADAGEPSVTALLAADIEAPVERVLLSRDRRALRAQVLLVPHHGSRTSSTEPFLDAIDPSIAVFQVGYRNRFHHPHPGVFERYRARRIELSRSDDDGAARIEAGGAGLSLERYRQTHRRYWMDR